METNYDKAIHLLESNDRPITPEDIQAAFLLLKKADEEGSDEAPYLIGEYAYFGIFCDADKNKAMEYYRKAADRGSTAAKSLLLAEEFGMDRPSTVMYYAFLESGLLSIPNDELID